MSVFHQMGHHSNNLVFNENLSQFSGAIISPVNYNQEAVTQFIQRTRTELDTFETIFDPQLYYPRSNRGQLRNWSYFPSDVETAEFSDFNWWRRLSLSLSATLHQIQPDSVCSPAIYPKVFNPEYYDFTNTCTQVLSDNMADSTINIYQTILLNLTNLSSYEYVMNIASILSRTVADGIYLVLVCNNAPRREIDDPEELKGAMLLIHLLESNGIHVIVSHSSSDIILWKASGATSCATGKFFNLRRFTPSRWDDADEGGGGQVPYLFEQNLLAFLRASDIMRIYQAGLLSTATQSNPFFGEIFSSINSGTPWLGTSWKFFLYWYANIEVELENNSLSVENLIRRADQNWGIVEDQNIILEERRNTGNWTRQWLRAIVEYNSPW